MTGRNSIRRLHRFALGWNDSGIGHYRHTSLGGCFGYIRGCVATACQPGSLRHLRRRGGGALRAQGVTDFEIWNEPNNIAFWQPAPNAAAYTTLLRDSYAAIKAVDPSALVITGGLAPEPDDGTNIDATTFVTEMFADGAKGSFNALGFHPYSFPALPNTYEPWSGWSQMGQTPTSLESILSANGDASVPLWLTEYGAPTSGPDGVGDTAQAEALTQAIADAKSTSWIGALYIYTYEDSGNDPSTDEDWFGLLNSDGTPKPAFAAVGAAIK